MVQYAMPSADAYNGDLWTDQNGGTANVYQGIADTPTTPDDTDFIDSNPAPFNAYVTKLLAVEDPVIDTGHVIRYRMNHLGVGAENATIQLRQAYVNEGSQGTLIESWVDSIPDVLAGPTDFSHTLANASSITDYSNLYIRFVGTATNIMRTYAASLEVPDNFRRARVYWVELEVPNLQIETTFIENRVKRFNEALLLEELAAANLTPSALYFGGGFTNNSGNLFRTWDPATTPKPGFVSGDLRFTYLFLPTASERVAIDAILDAHDGDALTTEQQSEDLDGDMLAELESLLSNYSEQDEFNQDTILRLAARAVLRLHDIPFPELESTPKPDQFTHDATNAGISLVPGTDDPSGVSDGDLWYNQTTNKFRAREGGTSKDLVGGGGSYTDEQAQDAVGTILTDSATVDFTYDDVTPAIAAVVPDNAITNGKLADMAQSTIKGRAVGAGTGDPTDLTTAQATAILDLFTSVLKGLVPASGGGTANFLRADGAWAAPGGGGAGQLELTFHSDANQNVTLTNQANSEQFLANNNRNIKKADLTNYTQVRLLARVVTASASVNSPRLYVEYFTSFTTTVGTYLNIGSSAVNCSLSATGLIDSGWINLVAGAKADVFITVLQNGGNAAADPALSHVMVQFR